MLRSLKILSVVTKFIFYGMMAYLLFLVAGILSGTYRFTDTDAPFYYLVAASGLAAVSFLLSDLHGFLTRRNHRKASAAGDSDTDR